MVLEPGRKESQQFQNVVPDIFGLETSELASLGAKRFHGKPPLIGLGAPRRSGGGRVQTFAIIRFLFGRALRSWRSGLPRGLCARRSGTFGFRTTSLLPKSVRPRSQISCARSPETPETVVTP